MQTRIKKIILLSGIMFILLVSAAYSIKILGFEELRFDGALTINSTTLSIKTNDIVRMFVGSGGNVGINKSSPNFLLDVAGQINASAVNVTGTVQATTFIGDGSSLTGISTGQIWNSSGSNVYLNDSTASVGIGTTNPLNTLEVVGTANASTLLASSGSASSPAFSFGEDTNTGMYRGAADEVRFSTGGSDRVTVDSSGNVGIGTTSPGKALSIDGDLEFVGAQTINVTTGTLTLTTDGGNGDITLTNDGTGKIGLGSTASGAHVWMSAPAQTLPASDNFHRVRVNNANALTVPTGTASLVTSLRVEEPNIIETGTLTTGATVYILDAPTEGTNNYALFVDAGDARFDGNVGIGTTSPNAKLEVQGVINVTTSSADIYLPDNRAMRFGDGGEAIIFYDGTNMQIDPNTIGSGYVNVGADLIVGSDNVFIGDTANTKMTQGLTINQGANDDEILAFKSSDVAHGVTGITETDTFAKFGKLTGDGGLVIDALDDTNIRVLLIRGNSPTETTTKSTAAVANIQFSAEKKSGVGNQWLGTDSNLLAIANAGTTRFIFDAEGDGHADSSWVTFSDGRLKKNQRELPYGLNEVMQLKPKIFDRYSGNLVNGTLVLENNARIQIGLVAQDMVDIIPEILEIPRYLNQSFYSLDYDRLGVVLVKALQELKEEKDAEIDTLNKENDELQSENIRLNNKLYNLELRISALEAQQ